MKKINKVLVALSILFVFGLLLIVSNSKVFASDENRITGSITDCFEVKTNLTCDYSNVKSYLYDIKKGERYKSNEAVQRLCIQNFFRVTPICDRVDEYHIYSDNSIVNAIPKDCFKTLGVNYSLGRDYGFITFTEYSDKSESFSNSFNKIPSVTNLISVFFETFPVSYLI